MRRALDKVVDLARINSTQARGRLKQRIKLRVKLILKDGIGQQHLANMTGNATVNLRALGYTVFKESPFAKEGAAHNQGFSGPFLLTHLTVFSGSDKRLALSASTS